MRWHRLSLLLALTGCVGGPSCPLIGCSSELTVRLPAEVTRARACVAGVCATTVTDGAVKVPLGRRAEGSSVRVTVTLPGRAAPYEGDVAVVRTQPNGPNCPPVCVNGTAQVDLAGSRVVSAPASPPAS